MYLQALSLTFTLILQVSITSGQRVWIPPSTTPAEMWNPYTWYLPYAVAAAEGYATFFNNAQQITNQLYTQAYITNAFGWSGGSGGGGGGGGGGGVPRPPGPVAGGTTNNAGGGQPVPNMSQGGMGWG